MVIGTVVLATGATAVGVGWLAKSAVAPPAKTAAGTVVAIMAGLLPIMWTHGTGASVMQRIAAPMIGGMVTSTMLTLVVIPVLYYGWRRSQVRESKDPHIGPA